MKINAGASRRSGRSAAAKLLAYSILASTSMGGLCAGPLAYGQVAAPAPVRQSVDSNGVDLFLGTMNVDGPTLSAGQGGAQGLAFRKLKRGAGIWGDNLTASLNVAGSSVVVVYGGKADGFTISGSSYISTEGNGSTLTLNSNVYTYTMSDGTIIHFNKTYVGAYPYGNVTGIVTDITRPDGDVTTYQFDSMQYCAANKPGGAGYICTQRRNAYRIGSITNNSKYRLDFVYGNWDGIIEPDEVPDSSFWQGWGDITGVTMTNTAVAGASLRTQGFGVSGGYFNITDEIGRTTGYRFVAAGVAGIKYPGSSGEDVTVAYDGANRVYTVATAAGTTTYNYSDNAGLRTTTVTDPLNHATVYVFDIASRRMKSQTDALLRTTQWEYDASGRLTKVMAPEGNYTSYAYDVRGNVTESRWVAKSGSGLADTITSAGYDASCAYAAKCNKPNWTRDAKNNQTDYSYDLTTGNLTSVTAPAPTIGSPRPTATYGYTSVNGVQLVSSVSTCRTTAACSGTADEIKTTISYNANGHPINVTKGAGDGSLVATTVHAYDDAGNLLTVDGPLAGAADTKRYRYDAARQLVGVVTADPDGSGALMPRAQRTTYDAKGRVVMVEAGNVSSQSDSAWGAFSSSTQVTTDYDAAGRKTKEALSAGGGLLHVSQYSYDAANRLECTAVRMNSSTWSALPGACSLATTGAAGPDRITRNIYDVADQLTTVQTAYGTVDQSNEMTNVYTGNGKLASVTDGEGNKTSYEYDGFDRLSITRYPVPTVAAGTSSSTDYEQLGYDAASNVISRRLRDGQTSTYGYDNLNRVTSKSTPGSVYLDWDTAYSYDLLGRVTNVVGDAWAGNAFAYDALGRLVTEQYYNATTHHAYDLAGRQTRLTWGDGFYVDYDYNVTGEVTAIRENGATSGPGVLASYAYDNLGRRSSVTRGNGTVTSYGYDGVSRLASLTQDLAGSAYDVTHSFSYNPAGQIASITRSNDAYAWNGHYNVDRPYTINGLNQVAAAGGTAVGYDGRGNLTSSGSSTYGYTAENRMASAPGITMVYEPAGDQLLQLYNGSSGADTRFAWSGGQMIAELTTYGAVTKRYVPGPGVDEPVLWYEGAGTSDRRWLHADERGSIVAVSDGVGNAIVVNRFDEYGIPASTNVGRFQYTGQAWMPELGMYYYKARMYSPTLGRFMQTDPVGYGDGMNLYNYVGSDPANKTDPTGKFGLFGGCPAGSRCLSTNPASSNANDAYRNAKLEQAITQAVPGISKAGVNQVLSCMNNPSPACMNERIADLPQNYLANAVEAAIKDSCRCSVDGSVIQPLNKNFAEVTDISKLPNIFTQSSTSGHAESAKETRVIKSDGNGPFSNYFVLKLYTNDADNGGRNTIAITTAVNSPRHYWDAVLYFTDKNLPINQFYARQYCLLSENC